MPLSIDQVIHGRYRIKRLLGQGGFGAVYEVWDESLDQACALKENLGDTEDVGRQFMREARLLAKLRHPNLPRVIDYFQIPNQGQYLVMDYVDGEDLDQLIKRTGGPLPEEQALKWIGQVCEALVYLHGQEPPVIHRDIKPANIRITPKGQAMLVDFGIAKVFDPSTYTTVGARAVTPGFSPPEQYGRGETDARSDIYALAATLYMLLTGKAPSDSIDQMTGSAPLTPEAASLNPTVDPVVSQAVAQGMNLSKTQRFQKVEAFQAALRNARTGAIPGGAAGGPFETKIVQVNGGVSTAGASAYPAGAPASPAGVSGYPAGSGAESAQVATGRSTVPGLPVTAAAPAPGAPASAGSGGTPAAPPPFPATERMEPVSVTPPPPAMARVEPVYAAQAAGAPRMPAGGKPAARRSPLVIVGVLAVVGVLLLAGIAGLAWLFGGADGENDFTATTQAMQATGTAIQAALHQPPAAPVQPVEPQPTAPGQPVEQPPAGGGEPIRIGLLAPLSGAIPSFGVSVREGVEQAVREWNERGGVMGRPIELVVGDSQCAADPAVAEANRLIDREGVRYIIGEVCSNASIPVSEIVNEKKVVQISPTSTNLSVTQYPDGRVKPFSFRACFIDPFQGLAMAKFARARGFQSAFILFDPDNEYNRGLAESFERAFAEQGGKIVGKEPYEAQRTDFLSILKTVADSQAQVLYVPDYFNIANLVGKQVREMGLPVVMLGGDGWDSADLDLGAVNGGFFTNHYDPSDNRPIVVEWVRRYGEAYKNEQGQPKIPDAIATLGYDATNLLIFAIEQAGVDDPARVAETLAGLKWETVSGVISFDPNHNPIKNVTIIGVQDGRKEFVESIIP